MRKNLIKFIYQIKVTSKRPETTKKTGKLVHFI
jgi:hypothetical protein